MQNFTLEVIMQPVMFSDAVRGNDHLRESFNDLAQATFGIDFSDWYAAGHWGDHYIPHVLTVEDTVISNVSVSLMRFRIGGAEKNYIQLGTVMTHEAYRGKGLNRQVMERVLEKYAGRVDGIYLFANDSVLDYYPKYGFRPVTETEYFLTAQQFSAAKPYELVPVEPESLYAAVSAGGANPNNGMYMWENLGLYQFWCAAEFGGSIFRIPEADAYAVAEADGTVLRICEIIGPQLVELPRLAASFGPEIREAVLCFTPGNREGLSGRPHREEDTTLFILGDDLSRIESEDLIFPAFSHA